GLCEVGVRVLRERARGAQIIRRAQIDPGVRQALLELYRRPVGRDRLAPVRPRIRADLILVIGPRVVYQANLTVVVVVPVLGADALERLPGLAELLAWILVATLSVLPP